MSTDNEPKTFFGRIAEERLALSLVIVTNLLFISLRIIIDIQASEGNTIFEGLSSLLRDIVPNVVVVLSSLLIGYILFTGKNFVLNKRVSELQAQIEELEELLGTHTQTLKTQMEERFKDLVVVKPPVIIKSPFERTLQINNDLAVLCNSPDTNLVKETIWFSGELSSLAISEDEPTNDENKEYKQALLRERDYLLKLARQGNQIRGIITPPNENSLVPERTSRALHRTRQLIQLLESDDEALENIELAISPSMQRSLYILGHLSCYDGYRVQQRYRLTLRQTSQEVIAANVSLYKELFNQLEVYTLTTYGERQETDRKEGLRKAVLNHLKDSLRYCEEVSSRIKTVEKATSD